jgi:alpha-amylase/alpha-mannosidase (GH57 family)
MKRFVCIHGHFYQPPRENPWLEEIERQDSAFPYHDWNERVTDECYGPNATARILSQDGRIEKIVNNYSRISFNFGPTLLSWMKEYQPEIYRALIEADLESSQRFSGHGSALAQVYNHIIMPLANARDRRTQVVWGLRDFESRFGRKAEGMWLAETAADLDSLEALAEHGVKFTILSPYQARRVRPIGGRNWREVAGGKIDPRMPYRHALPSGRSIDLFFYDGPIAQSVAFEGVLNRGEDFARRLLGALDDNPAEPQLVHIATDGETYGHHHRYGDMALAYALDFIERDPSVALTNYGEYLEKFPPQQEVQIEENTSWSCAHGVERWRSNCGCYSGAHPGWSQEWRGPLRKSLDLLRDDLAGRFESEAAALLKDPWAARNDYIEVVLDRSVQVFQNFLKRHAAGKLDAEQRVRAARLLEMQRNAMLMYTSCGWFFDDLAGIETVQILAYAGRVIQLAQQIFGDHIESQVLESLEPAISNLPKEGNGREIYERHVRPAFVDLMRVGAHYIITSLFHGTKVEGIHSYRVDREDHREFEIGRNRMVLGRGRFTSDITLEEDTLVFGAVYFAHHTVNAGVRVHRGDEAYQALVEEASSIFQAADYPKIIRTFDKHFGDSSYSLFSLFRDQQQSVLDIILSSTMAEIETHYRSVYEDQAPLIRFLHELGARVPQPLQMTAELVLNARMKELLSAEDPNQERIVHTLDEAHGSGVKLNEAELQLEFQAVIERKAAALAAAPESLTALNELHRAARIFHELPFAVGVRRAQNIVYDLIESTYQTKADRGAGDPDSARWVETFRLLAEIFHIKLDG